MASGRGTAAPEPLSEAEVEDLQQRMQRDWQGAGLLGGSPGEGRLEVQVLFDDGTLQACADDTYGRGVVLVTSALRPMVR